MTTKYLSIGVILVLGALVQPVFAKEPTKGPTDSAIDSQILTRDFLNAHPDIKYRIKGMEAYDGNKRIAAFQYFRRAAFYADKPSQGMLAEMLWKGEGETADHALAYVWMDIAAERGFPIFVTQRERYWALLDEKGRARAIEQGADIRSVYADAAAEPRIASKIRFGRMSATGSHLGSSAGSALIVTVPGPGGKGRSVDGTTYFSPKYWDPVQYRAWRDEVWSARRVPTVQVGALEKVVPDTDAKPESRLPEVAPDLEAREPEVPKGTP